MFLGIDESNHGGPFEIYTCRLTSNSENIEERKISKRGNRGRIYGRSLPFYSKYILFEKNIFNNLEAINYPLISISTFADYFKDFGLEKIFMDGEMNFYVFEQTKKSLYEINKNIELFFGKKLDEKIPVVAEADRIANRLYHYYKNSSGSKNKKYQEHMLKPNLKKYEKFFI